MHSTSHSKDNERRLRAGACFNLSSAKLRKKKLSEYEKILFDTLILYDTKKYEKIRIFSIFFLYLCRMSGELLSPSKKQSITNKNISKQKTIKQHVLLYILLFLLVFLNGESNSESHDVSFLFVSFLFVSFLLF